MRAPGRILVTGATGFIGRHLLRALLDRGYETVILTRAAEPPAFWDGRLSPVTGDVTDPAAVSVALRGVTAVAHLAAATQGSDPARYHRVNVEGTRTLVAASRVAGVRRFVALSTITANRRVVGVYGATKREMERIVLESGLEGVVLRPHLVYGPGDRGLFARMVGLVESLPVVPVIGRGRQLIQPVHVDDVVRAILRCLEAPHVAGCCYDLVGPNDVTLDEFLHRIGRTLGVRKRHVHIPVPLALVAARAMAAVMRDPPISVDNVIGADQPTPFDRAPARRDLGLRQTALTEGLPTILDPPPSPAVSAGRPLRVVIVGLGKMGVAHTALFSMVPGARVAAAVDVQRGSGRALRGMGFRVPFFTSLEDALDATRPDAVVIATPPHTHADLARLAARHGVGVLVEKPLAHTLEAARALVDAVTAAGVTASCGYTLAYLPTFERARELLDAGALGTVDGFHATMFISQVFGPKRGWMYEPAKSGGGVLPNIASHLLFLLHWYFGRALEVEAKTERLFTAVDDAARLRLRFTGGVEGTVETSWSVQGYPLSRTSIRVEGTNGHLHVDNERIVVNLRDGRAGFGPGATRIHAAELPQRASFSLGGDGYFAEDRDFARALRGGPEVRTSIGRALHVQVLLDAAYRSAERGGERVEVSQ